MRPHFACVTVLAIAIISTAANGLSTTGDRDGRKLFGGYRITPKFCRASKTLPRSDPRSHGPTICMFNHECTQRQGEVVGACMDGFLFGACCQLQGSVDSPLIVEHSLLQQSAAAQSYETYGNQQQHHPSTSVVQNSLEESNDYAERPALQSHNRPSNQHGALASNYGAASNEDDSSNDVDAQLSQTNNRFSVPPNAVVVDNDSVSVSSPSPEYASSPGFSSVSNYNSPSTSSTEDYASASLAFGAQSQQDELPTQITTGHYEASGLSGSGSDGVIASGPDSYADFADQIMHIQSGDFTHSGITHPGVDAVIVDQDSTGYGGPSNGLSSPSAPEHTPTPTIEKTTMSSSSTTERTFKVTHAKPAFRPKPTKVIQINTPDSDKYVLIQTINHDVEVPVKVATPTKQNSAMTDNDIESIESIILMLNDTKTGPQYNSDGSSTEPGSTIYYGDHTATIYGVQGSTSHQQQQSTASIDYNKYGSSSHYVTEKIAASSPKPPSTSYVYSPQPTGRPIQVQSTISSSYGAVFQDINPVHLNVPSSSEGYFSSGSDFVTQRPIAITTASFITASKQPSTNYLYAHPTSVRPLVQDPVPTTLSTKKPQTTRPPSSTYGSTSRPKIPEPTTVKLPSTSFVYSSTAPPKRITKPTNKVNPSRKNVTISGRPTSNVVSSPAPSTILYEEVIHSKPIGQVNVAASVTTEQPSPTVHITPKPTSNQVTSSFWSQSPTHLNHYTTPTINAPSNSYIYHPVTTPQPNYDYSTPSYTTAYGSPIIYTSSHPTKSNTQTNDFNDGGYHGPPSTLRPGSNNQDFGYTSGAPQTTFYGPTFGPEVQHFVEYSTIHDEVDTSQNDLNNFPPVRNPNLNTTSNVVQPPAENIATPTFVEDEVLNDKMGVLVSKIVESLQGNFEELADVVYDDVVQQDPTTLRPASNTKRPSVPSTKKPVVTKKPATLSARPANTTKATARPVATTKKPTVVRVSTVKPVVSTATPAKRTTKKPAAATTVSTKKPVVTKVPSTRRPTAKPTKKVVATTTVAQQDEIVEEDEEEDEEGDEEEETAGAGEETANGTGFEEGRLQCGVRPQIKTGRIVGGKAAAFGEFPWQVLVRESTWLGLFTKNKCGGVLVSKMYVMTAAHCQPGFLASLVTVFGEFDISGELEAKRSVTKNVRRVVVHRDYDASTFENDLALLELESAIHYDTHIVPICMPADAADFTGRMATVTGWGRLKYGGGVPTVMQEVQVPVIENSVCQEMFHTAGHNKKILSSFLCAGYANGQKDSCEGDSGGPLVIERTDGRWELAGTVSHGIKCAAPYLPGVYMRTTFYKPWLQSITGVH